MVAIADMRINGTEGTPEGEARRREYLGAKFDRGYDNMSTVAAMRQFRKDTKTEPWLVVITGGGIFISAKRETA